MIPYRCDGCGTELKPDGSNLYILKIEAFAAVGKLEFTWQDLQRDHEAEIRQILAEMQNYTTEELEDQVYRALHFDLCPSCHRKFLAAPLAGLRGSNITDPDPES